MKKSLLILSLCVVFMMGCSSSNEHHQEKQQIALDTLPILVTQIQKCARLYTTEYHIHKIVTHDDVLRLKGNVLRQQIDIPLPLGERKIAIPMDATLKAYIDFSDFSERNIERYGEHIVIILPDPKIVMTSSKINQKDIKEYVGLTRSQFTDKELSSYEQQGRQAILNSVSKLTIKEQAQANAARVLVPMLTEMGYQEKNVTIAFRKGLNIEKLINTNPEQE